MTGRLIAYSCVCGLMLTASQVGWADSGCQTAVPSWPQTQVWVPRAQHSYREQASYAAAETRPTVASGCAPCEQAQAAPACVQMQTVYQAVPKVTEIDRVETVMVNQVRYETYQQTVMQPVYRTMSVPVTVPVQTLETMVGTRRVLQNVAVRVQRPVTTQCQCVQSSLCGVSTYSTGAPVTRMVETVENRQVWVDQQYTFQAPVTNYVTQYQAQQVLDYQPTVQTMQVPVTVQVPVQQTRKEQVVNYEYVATQVPVVR